MVYSAVVVAAGAGSRSKLPYNKVFYPLEKKQWVLDGALASFIQDARCTQIVVVVAKDEVDVVSDHLAGLPVQVVVGGATRQASVFAGLKVVSNSYVLVHDGARPYLSIDLLDDLLAKMPAYGGAILAMPAVDTLKLVSPEGVIQKTLNREQVWQAQTPQAFNTDLLKACHEKAIQEGVVATDDAALVEQFGDADVYVVHSQATNLKITRPNDLPKGEDR